MDGSGHASPGTENPNVKKSDKEKKEFRL